MAYHFIVQESTRSAVCAAAAAALDAEAPVDAEAAKIAIAAYAALLAPATGDDEQVEGHAFRLSVSCVTADVGDIGSPEVQMLSFGVEASLVGA